MYVTSFVCMMPQSRNIMDSACIHTSENRSSRYEVEQTSRNSHLWLHRSPFFYVIKYMHDPRERLPSLLHWICIFAQNWTASSQVPRNPAPKYPSPQNAVMERSDWRSNPETLELSTTNSSKQGWSNPASTSRSTLWSNTRSTGASELSQLTICVRLFVSAVHGHGDIPS